MQFVVPQFIEVEAKVIGPITARQFIILLIGAGFMFLAYKLADFTLFILEGLIIFIITGTFAFVKINGRPFHYFLLNLIQTLKKPKLRVWQKEELQITTHKLRKEKKKKEEKFEGEVKPRKQLNPSRLSELSLVVDTGGAYKTNLHEFTTNIHE
jgi:hypothetical protein